MNLAPLYALGWSHILFTPISVGATLVPASFFFTRGIGTFISAIVVHVAMSNISIDLKTGLRYRLKFS